MKRVRCQCGTSFKANPRRALAASKKPAGRKYQHCPSCEELVDVTEEVKK